MVRKIKILTENNPNKTSRNHNQDFISAPYVNKTNQILLTCPDELRLALFAVTFGADGVHAVLVVLTTACIGEVTCVVWRPALSHFARVVHGCCHIVEGVVGGLPAEDDHAARAIVNGVRVRWSTWDCGNEMEN